MEILEDMARKPSDIHQVRHLLNSQDTALSTEQDF